jgi:hypothetical protein
MYRPVSRWWIVAGPVPFKHRPVRPVRPHVFYITWKRAVRVFVLMNLRHENYLA